MKRIIEQIIERNTEGNYLLSNSDKEKMVSELLDLCDVRISLFQKNRLDLLNWTKSELKQETNTKLGKTINPYRSNKIVFLRRIISLLNNEA